MEKICKIVYFDEESVTDYVQIVASGELSTEQNQNIVRKWYYSVLLALEEDEKDMYKVSDLAGTNAILNLEPLILDDGDDELELKIQTDHKGKDRDVRDVLIIRKGINRRTV